MFRGRYETTVDTKGRTSLPARFRDVLTSLDDDRLVVTTAFDPCLVAYPLSEWRKFEARLGGLPTFDAAVVQLKRFYVGGAIESAVDSHGRILIPQPQRAHAAIERDVVWCGMVGHVEIWDAARWSELFESTRAGVSELTATLAKLDI